MIATLFLQILFTTQVKIKTLPCCCNRIMSVQYIPFLTSLSFFFFHTSIIHSKSSIVLSSLTFCPFFYEIIELKSFEMHTFIRRYIHAGD